MGVNRTPADGLLSGVVLHDWRLTPDTLAALGAGSTDSDYTEGNPYPGAPEPDRATGMILRASGSQSAGGSIDLRTVRSGMPGPEAARFAWRDTGGGSASWRGHTPYPVVTGWTTLRAVNGTEIGHVGVCRLLSGDILAAWDSSGLASGDDMEVRRYSADSGTWSTSGSFTPEDTRHDLGPALGQGPDGRVYLMTRSQDGGVDEPHQWDVYSSDDDGDTWAIYSRRVVRGGIPTTITISATDYAVVTLGVRMARLASGSWVAVVPYTLVNGGTTHYSWQVIVSTDECASWDLVGEDHRSTYGESVGSPNVLPLVGGGWAVVAWYGSTASYGMQRMAGAVSTPTDTWTQTTGGLAITSQPTIAAWADEDGTVYAVYRGQADEIWMAYSIDDCQSWARSAYRILGKEDQAAGGSKWWIWMAASSTRGRAVLLAQWDGPATNWGDGSIACLYLGAQETMTMPRHDYVSGLSTLISADDYDLDSVAWGRESIGANARMGWLWLPMEAPESVGWTAAGAGTGTLSTTTGILDLGVATVANTRTYTVTQTSDYVTAAIGEAIVNVTAGGSATAKDIAYSIRISDYDGTPASATYRAHVTVRIGPAGYTLYDEVAAAQVGSTVVGLSQPFAFRVALDSAGKVQAWHTEEFEAADTTWTQGPYGSLTTTAADVPCQVQWGHLAAGTAGSRWRMLGACLYPGYYAVGVVGTAGDRSAWSNPGSLHGFPIGSTGTVTADGVRLAGTRGPTRIGDSWVVAAASPTPIQNLHPTVEPSPSRGWESVDDASDMDIVWEWVTSGYGGKAVSPTLVVGLLGANVRTASLQGWTGAAWTTLVSVDTASGFSSLEYTAAEGCLQVDTGSSLASRPILEDELVGATVYMTDGGSTALRTVVRNTTGAWDPSTSTCQVRVYVGGWDGTEPSTGSLDIWMPDTVTYAHDVTTSYSHLRLHIGAQDTVSGTLRVGTAILGGVTYLGRRCSFGWSDTLSSGAQWQGTPAGVGRAWEAAPPKRVRTLSFDDAILTREALTAGVVPSYVVAGTSRVAVEAAPIHTLQGLYRSGNGLVRPLLFLPRIGQSGETLTARDLFCWGRITSDLRVDDVRGAIRGVDAMARMPAIEITEER